MENNIAQNLTPIVSVIIPCYNSGEFLPDALASVLGPPHLDRCEIIVVDDGSTDGVTLQVLKKAEHQGCKVIYQSNKGPAAARNKGIANAIGKYIMLLDSDNKIRHDYITEGIAVLDANPKVGVVYGNPAFFGLTTTSRFATHAFDPFKILVGNNIDMCSMIRKSMWAEVGGLDENRVLIGHEDWEFWIRVSAAGWQFAYIDKILFDYRIRENSLITQATQSEPFTELIEYIHKKHYLYYAKSYEQLYKQYAAYRFDKSNPVRAFIKYLYLKYFK